MRRISLMVLCAALIAGTLSGCGGAVPAGQEETEATVLTTAPAEETAATEQTEPPAETEAPVVVSNDFKIALITPDRIDRYWLALEEGAMRAAAELGCEVVNLSPRMKDDTLQMEQIRNAVSTGCQAIVIAANGPDAVSGALQEAAAAGVKLICVDSPANVQVEAVCCTDNQAAGRTAGETMIAALEARGITEGAISVIGVNADTGFALQREAGFRGAFEGKAYTLLETRYSEGDAASSHAISGNDIAQGVVGIFCCAEGCTNGAGNAVKETGGTAVVVGFGESDAISGLVGEGFVLAAMAQNPGIMGYEGVKAACASLNGAALGGAVIDTGVSVLAF